MQYSSVEIGLLANVLTQRVAICSVYCHRVTEESVVIVQASGNRCSVSVMFRGVTNLYVVCSAHTYAGCADIVTDGR